MSLFGGAAQSTPAFGATPAFGSTAPTPAFGAAPSAFGAAPSTSAAPSAFGAAPAASAFGAAPATSAFGGGLAAPTFGAATTTPSAFGAAPATPSAFGAPASTPSLFGASPLPTPATGGGLFGASQTPASGGLFGASPSPFGATSAFGGAPAASPFGATAAPQPSAGMFGAPAPAAAPVGGGDAAVRELQAIEEAYRPGAPNSSFTHFFLNVVDNPAQRVKPPQVDHQKWREAMKQAASDTFGDRLWPVQATGFGHLLERKAAQDEAIGENEERLAALRSAMRQLSRKHEIDIQERKEAIVRRHQELCHRLLHVMRAVDGAEGRLAVSMGISPAQGGDLMQQHRRVAAVEAAVAPSSAGGLQRQVEALASAARLRAGGAMDEDMAVQNRVEEESLRQLFKILEQHMSGVRKLQEVLARDQRDMEILARGASS